MFGNNPGNYYLDAETDEFPLIKPEAFIAQAEDESPEGYADAVWFLPNDAFIPLEFTEISEVNFYSNLEPGIGAINPCYIDAGRNHVFPISELHAKADEGYFLSENLKHGTFRIVQSVDFYSLWVGREGASAPNIMVHCQGAKVRSLANPNVWIDNDRALNGGTCSYTVVTQIDESSHTHANGTVITQHNTRKKCVIHTITNTTGHFKSKFNDLQLLLIALWKAIQQNENVFFADTVRFVMDANEWLQIPVNKRPPSRYFQITREDLISMIERLETKYTEIEMDLSDDLEVKNSAPRSNPLLCKDNLLKYDRENRFPVTYIEVKDAEDLRKKRLELSTQEEQKQNCQAVVSPSKLQKLLPLSEMNENDRQPTSASFEPPPVLRRKPQSARRSENRTRTSSAQMSLMLDESHVKGVESKENKENIPPVQSFGTPPKANSFVREMMANLENEARQNEITRQLVTNFREQVATPSVEMDTSSNVEPEAPRTPVKGF